MMLIVFFVLCVSYDWDYWFEYVTNIGNIVKLNHQILFKVSTLYS